MLPFLSRSLKHVVREGFELLFFLLGVLGIFDPVLNCLDNGRFGSFRREKQ